jgi:hypothetical protein
MTQEPGGIIRPSRTIELDFAKFDQLAVRHGWMSNGGYNYGRIAMELAMSERHVYRVLDRESRPGGGFIGGLITAAEELSCPAVFRIVNADNPIGRD